jgi:mannose-1-phosphate guanylyltransferase / mannose-6-phosphate isomerase
MGRRAAKAAETFGGAADRGQRHSLITGGAWQRLHHHRACRSVAERFSVRSVTMHEIVDLDQLKAQRFAKIHPVILSGGAGTRLWPLSRASLPKQFLPLTSERTMFQETLLRNLEDAVFGAPIVVCNDEHRFVMGEQLEQLGILPRQVLLEPAPHNTGPALAAAALWLVEQEPGAIMLVQPADHVIGSIARLHQAVLKGLSAATQGRLVVFGVRPTRPEPGYGYIAAGAALDGGGEVLEVDRFIEKPEPEAARRLVESGRFYWNSGIFLLAARHYLDELERLHPTMLEACRRALHEGTADLGFFRLAADAFGECPSLSIDRTIMEHTDRGAVVPVDMAWSDVGCWQALWKAMPPDECGNVVRGPAIVESVRNCYVHAEDRLVAAIGVEDVVVVSTDDAVLVAKADRAADVSDIVRRLRGQNRQEAVQHSMSYRPWGAFKTVDRGERFQVKRLTVKSGGRLSLQKHFHRAEHWVVVQGTALVRRGDEIFLVTENQSVYIPIGVEHRLENPGKVPLHLIEVQSGAYLGEDDIVRIADGYGRA